MGTTADKLSYLAETKSKLKDTINYTGAGIDANTTFRNYDKKLYDGLADALKDDTTLWTNMPKVSATNTSITLNGTANTKMKLSLAPSELSQSETPSPSSPQTIHSITGNNTIKIADSDSTQTQTLPLNLGTNEYCKIGNYADEFIKTSGKNLIPTSPDDWEQGGINPENGVNTSPTTRIRTIGYYPIENDKNYYVSIQNTNYCFLNIILYNSNKTYVGQYYNINGAINGTTGLNIKIPSTSISNVAYMRVAIRRSDNTSTITSSEINTIQPMINEGNTALPYEPYGTGDWYIKKNIGKVVLDENEDWQERTNNGGHKQFYCHTSARNIKQENQKCNYGVFDNAIFNWSTEGKFALLYNTYTLYLGVNDNAVLNDFKTTIASNNVVVYYPLATPTYTLLDNTLQEQLEHIYNELLSYEGQTNISQTNADLPFVITANGIKSYDNI